jgi:hypothetical protein
MNFISLQFYNIIIEYLLTFEHYLMGQNINRQYYHN